MELPPVFRTAALVAGGLALIARSAPAAEEAPLELPVYTVTTERELPPPEQWYYARIEGFEVLSGTSERTTRELSRDFQNFAYALDLIWPGMRPDNASPAKLLLCGQRKKFEEFLPASLQGTDRITSFNLRVREQSAIVVDQQTRFLPPGKTDALTASPDASAPTDDTGTAVPLILTNAYQQLYHEYIRYLLSARETAPPSWLSEGLTQLLMNLHISETEISLGRVENPNDAGSPQESDFNGALKGSHLLPLGEMFAATTGATTSENTMNIFWAKQCYAFVHWGLYGDYGRHQKEFITFIHRLDREPLNEALFKECFKEDYREMLQTLRNHIVTTRYKFAGVRADKGQKIPWPPVPVVREATQAEVGRLMGDVLAFAGHPEEARATFITAYRRGERDPALLAALGLAEANGGDAAKARQFLEAAAAAKVVRPRAYVELARLRLDSVRAKPEGGNGKLSPKQTAGVLEPLFTARSQPPALPEIYELIAETWAANAGSPGAAQLAVLDEGVRLFPRNAALVYSDAALKAKAGQIAEAQSLIRLGLRVATDKELRAKFESLQAGLPPVPPAPAKG